MAKEANPFGVAVGQIWASTDKRDHGKTVTVIEVDDTHARVDSGARKARVRLDRFRPNSTGWRRVS